MKDKLKDYFGKQKGVVCAYLFGSAAKGKENKFSDVDVAVLFDDGISRKDYIRKKLSVMDDLSSVLDRDVDVVILNEASPFLRFQVIKNGLRIYEFPERREHNFEARSIVEYLDFLPVRRRLETALLNSIKKA